MLSLAKNLQAEYGSDWLSYEPETVLLDHPEISLDELECLRIILLDPSLFWEDPVFFLHACSVLSEGQTNFEYLPQPNSLQIAKALVLVEKLTGKPPQVSLGVKLCIYESLVEDGYSTTIYPFTLATPSFPLEPGQEPEDIAKKKQAIEILCNNLH